MIIASIDLMDGKAVQLRQGREKVLEIEDYRTLARRFDRYGEIAVIDLDAAMGRGNNERAIRDILRLAECRIGGGIKTVSRARELLALGARKIIIGSMAFKDRGINTSFLKRLRKGIGSYPVIIAVDAWKGRIVTSGWRRNTSIEVLDAVKRLEGYCSELLFTCTEREGTMCGIDLKLVRRITRATRNKITAAGGVATLDEIRELSGLGVDVQLGMALYTGRIALGDAFIESLNWKKGLIPTITQDISGTVLMLAYSNKGSLKRMFETGWMWYFSRSRNELWLKGRTSGNAQELVKIRADCDRDALLAVVRQKGAACHTGSYSCFKTPTPTAPPKGGGNRRG